MTVHLDMYVRSANNFRTRFLRSTAKYNRIDIQEELKHYLEGSYDDDCDGEYYDDNNSHGIVFGMMKPGHPVELSGWMLTIYNN